MGENGSTRSCSSSGNASVSALERTVGSAWMSALLCGACTAPRGGKRGRGGTHRDGGGEPRGRMRTTRWTCRAGARRVEELAEAARGGSKPRRTGAVLCAGSRRVALIATSERGERASTTRSRKLQRPTSGLSRASIARSHASFALQDLPALARPVRVHLARSRQRLRPSEARRPSSCCCLTWSLRHGRRSFDGGGGGRR